MFSYKEFKALTKEKRAALTNLTLTDLGGFACKAIYSDQRIQGFEVEEGSSLSDLMSECINLRRINLQNIEFSYVEGYCDNVKLLYNPLNYDRGLACLYAISQCKNLQSIQLGYNSNKFLMGEKVYLPGVTKGVTFQEKNLEHFRALDY